MEIKIHNTAGCFLTRQLKGETQLLLLYKSWPGQSAGWVPPKGHIEKGETPEAAALRETREETGYVNIVSRGFLKTIRFAYPWDDGFLHKKTIHWFHAELVNDEMKQQELSEAEKNSIKKQAWFAMDKANEIMKFDDEKEVLAILAKLLST